MLSPNQIGNTRDRFSNTRYGMVTYSVLGNNTLSVTAKALYSLLSTYVSKETDDCWPSLGTLADHLNLSQRTISRAMAELESRQIIGRFIGGHQTKSTRLLK